MTQQTTDIESIIEQFGIGERDSLPDEIVERLSRAVFKRYSMSYDLENDEYVDYEHREEDDRYPVTVWVSKWTAVTTKSHKARARWDESDERWVIDQLGSSGWR